MKQIVSILFLTCIAISALGQEQKDSIQVKRLDEITIKGERDVTIDRLSAIEGTR